jgi:hypothetical protein
VRARRQKSEGTPTPAISGDEAGNCIAPGTAARNLGDDPGSLEHPLLRLKFGSQLPFGFKPVFSMVTMLTAARDVDLKRAVGNLDVGWLPFSAE